MVGARLRCKALSLSNYILILVPVPNPNPHPRLTLTLTLTLTLALTLTLTLTPALFSHIISLPRPSSPVNSGPHRQDGGVVPKPQIDAQEKYQIANLPLQLLGQGLG